MTLPTYLDLRVIRGNSEADKTERNRERLIHVDFGVGDPGHYSICRIEAGGPRTDDGHPERRILCSSTEAIAGRYPAFGTGAAARAEPRSEAAIKPAHGRDVV